MTSLVKDGPYYLARLYVTRRRLEQAESGEHAIDDETLEQLGADLVMLGDKLRELYPVKSQTANVVRLSDHLARKRGKAAS
jgi:hypothetical protein